MGLKGSLILTILLSVLIRSNILEQEAIERSKTSPPRGTRAHGRGELVKLLMEHEAGYLIDWIGFRLNKEEPFLMLDPFVSYKKEIKGYLEGLNFRDGQNSQEIF